MDPTSNFGSDTALSAVEGLQPPARVAPEHASDASTTASPDHWLSRAMALWLRDTDSLPNGFPPLAPH